MLDSFQLGWTHRPHRERSAGHTESAVGGEIAAICPLHPKLGRNAAVWGGFNEINKLTRQAAPAPEARGGQRLTKDQFVIARRTEAPLCPRVGTHRTRQSHPSRLILSFSETSRCVYTHLITHTHVTLSRTLSRSLTHCLTSHSRPLARRLEHRHTPRPAYDTLRLPPRAALL